MHINLKYFCSLFPFPHLKKYVKKILSSTFDSEGRISMKKRTKQMISFSIAAAMGLSLTACGGKQAEAPQTTAAETKAE